MRLGRSSPRGTHFPAELDNDQTVPRRTRSHQSFTASPPVRVTYTATPSWPCRSPRRERLRALIIRAARAVLVIVGSAALTEAMRVLLAMAGL